MHRLHLCHDPSQLMAGVSCPGDFIPTLLPTTACDSMPARHLLRKSYPASCVVFRTRSSTRLDSTARLCHFPYSLEYETRLARVRDSTQPLACATFRTRSSTRLDSTARLCHFPYLLEYETRLDSIRWPEKRDASISTTDGPGRGKEGVVPDWNHAFSEGMRRNA